MPANSKGDIITNAIIPIRLAFFMWAIFFLEFTYQVPFSKYGIMPRTESGLIGVFMAPMLHGSVAHIISNTLPILFLGGILFNFYKPIAKKVFYWCYLFTGLLVWLMARPSYHIGASGLVYGLAFFLMFYGLFKKDFKSIIISIITVVIYSGLFYGIFPNMSNVSWESHLFGAMVGVITAFYFGKRQNQSKTSS
jgi:membrane associated rhomboid family serine protease